MVRILYIQTTMTSINGQITFVPLLTLEETLWLPNSTNDVKDGHRKFFFDIQKILVFRELLRIGSTNLRDILVKIVGKHLFPLSIDETTIKMPGTNFKGLSQDLEKFFFPKTISKTEVIIRMFGLTKENYQNQISVIRNSLSRILNRVDTSNLVGG